MPAGQHSFLVPQAVILRTLWLDSAGLGDHFGDQWVHTLLDILGVHSGDNLEYNSVNLDVTMGVGMRNLFLEGAPAFFGKLKVLKE